ncbi:MAG: alpha-galactosidase, partial [Oscillospiraceae bacterium]|nr:alpha-galactosidase [Oscillospiraceae bacterium]
MTKVINVGGMTIEYPEKDGQRFGMRLRLNEEPRAGEKRDRIERPLVQCKIVGDNYPTVYLCGSSMIESDSSYRFKFDREETEVKDGKTVFKTYMKTENGIEAVYVNEFRENARYITAYTEMTNNSGEEIALEMLSSFSMYGISPYNSDAAPESYVLHRARSKWSREARFVEEPLEELLLEDTWTYWHTKSVRFGQVGSMPVKDYFPFMALEDKKNGVIWGVMMESQASWQMEVFRDDDCIGLSGGIADREFGHWMKKLAAGEKLTTNKAYISVCRGGLDDIADRLLDAQRELLGVPESEEALPVIFNEYCTTWGCPSQENIFSILEAIKDRGVDYFVVDCGWFKEEGVSWDISMGDYVPSKVLFPD